MTSTQPDPGPITVIGEALIDLVPGERPGAFGAFPGGSPYNVAIGLARLGQRTALMARLASNAFGRLLRDKAAAEGIDLSAAPLATQPTTLAVVNLDANASASYDFYVEGTADWQWTDAEMAAVPAATSVLHFGSLAAWTPPGDVLIRALARRFRESGGVLVSYDPNVRPSLLTDPALARRVVEAGVAVAHLVKASADDIAYLYLAGLPPRSPRNGWISGPGWWSSPARPAAPRRSLRPGPPSAARLGRSRWLTRSRSTGGSFTAGLLDSLVRRDLHDPSALAGCPAGLLAASLDDAIMVASLNSSARATTRRRWPRSGPRSSHGKRQRQARRYSLATPPAPAAGRSQQRRDLRAAHRGRSPLAWPAAWPEPGDRVRPGAVRPGAVRSGAGRRPRR